MFGVLGLGLRDNGKENGSYGVGFIRFRVHPQIKGFLKIGVPLKEDM